MLLIAGSCYSCADVVRQTTGHRIGAALSAVAGRRGHVVMKAARSTTILSVRRGEDIALGGDGQVTLGNVVAKHHAAKIRKVGGGKVLVGVAGSAADAFA